MASREYEVEVTVTSARDLKNINWKYGPLKPYIVVWVDPEAKVSTKVDDEGDMNPYWDETRVLRLNRRIEDSTLCIDIVHAKAEDEDTKSLIGSARLPLREILDNYGIGERVERTLRLKRPSGRPHGKVDVKVCVREYRYPTPGSYYAPPYGVPPSGSRDYLAPPSYGAPPPAPYQAPPLGPYHGDPVSAGHPYYGQPSYGQQAGYGQQPYYGQQNYGQQPYEEKKKSKFGGVGTGLAVGAVAGALGGIALVEGAGYVKDKIAEDAAEKVEDDLGFDDDAGDYGGDDF